MKDGLDGIDGGLADGVSASSVSSVPSHDGTTGGRGATASGTVGRQVCLDQRAYPDTLVVHVEKRL